MSFCIFFTSTYTIWNTNVKRELILSFLIYTTYQILQIHCGGRMSALVIVVEGFSFLFFFSLVCSLLHYALCVFSFSFFTFLEKMLIRFCFICGVRKDVKSEFHHLISLHSPGWQMGKELWFRPPLGAFIADIWELLFWES